jgi:fucose 4-O-acetylase-like acetyltransferase
MNRERRESWVDLAKGVGIILVVFGHISWGICNAGLQCDRPAQTLVHSVLYTFHMPLFFFLAGLFLKRSLVSQGGPGGLVKNKINTIAYPYVVWSLLQGGVELLFARYKNGGVTVADVLAFPWQPRMQLWFLYTLFCVFLASSWLFARIPARHQPWILLPVMVIYAAKVYVHDLQALHDFARCMPYFVLGALFADHSKRYFSFNRAWLLVLPAAAIAMQWVFHGPLGLLDEDPEPLFKFPMALASVMAVVSVCWALQRFDIRWLATLGQASLFIFTMHTMIGVAVRAVLAKTLHTDAFWVHTILATLAGLLLPTLIHQRFASWVRYLYEPPRFLALRPMPSTRLTKPHP